jgi:ABC-type nitrate/sulfonate/bicarbonate transport system substrate-binding protein
MACGNGQAARRSKMFIASRLFLMRQSQAFLGSILVLMVPVTVAGAEIGGKPEKAESTIAYVSPSAAFTPLFVAAEAGLFAKYGLKVKLQFLNATVAVKGLLAEEVDICVDGPNLITPRLGGAPVKYFGAYMQRYVFQIWGAKEIAKLEQLKGKVIAVQSARGAIDIATREALKKYGLIPDSDVKFTYNQQGTPAILTGILTGKTPAGTLSAPITLEAQKAGLNLLADIAELNIPGLQGAYGATEKFHSNNPNAIYAFSKAMAEGVVVARKDSAGAKRAIGKFLKVDDPKILDASYDGYAPYWEMSLAVRDQVIRAELDYLDEKEFPKAKNANPREFFDNSFVENLERSGFFASISLGRQK